MRRRRIHRALAVGCLVVVCLAVTVGSLGVAVPRAAASGSGISGFSPASGPLNTHVTISGSGFIGAAGVTFGGVAAAKYSVRSDNRVTATVPWNAASGQVCVILATGAQVCSSNAFTVTLGLAASKTTVHPTQRITLSGSGFAPNELINISMDQMNFAQAMSNGAGGFSLSQVVIPQVGAGQHAVEAYGVTSQLFQTVIMIVTWDWPQFRHDPQQMSNSLYEDTLNTGNVSTLVKKWNESLPSGHGALSAIIENGIVYYDDNDTLFAVDETTGGILWQQAVTSSFVQAPAIDGRLVYMGWETPGVPTQGGVTAFDAKTGVPQWTFGSDGITGTPVIANGILYVESQHGNLYAFHDATGVPYWTDLNINANARDASSVAVANGLLYYVSCNWPDGSNAYLNAVSAATGSPIWSESIGSCASSSPMVADGTVSVGSQQGTIYGFDAKTGKYRFADPLSSIVINSSPAVANGLAVDGLEFVGSSDGSVYGIDVIYGTIFWQFTTGNGVSSSPAVANGVVYVGSDDGNVYALDAATGAELWSYAIGGAGNDSPAIADGALFIASGSQMYKFGLP